jgi:high-affinity Fe2+/Pb2+ permease
MIGIGTALILYAVLAGIALATLKGLALAIALIIVGGLAVKSWVQHLRRRLED